MTTMFRRKPRPVLDSIPEMTRYRDDGCALYSACLSCPLPRCRYDEPDDGHNVLKQVRNTEVLQAFAQGLSAHALSMRFGLSKRTVHRILQDERSRRRSLLPHAG